MIGDNQAQVRILLDHVQSQVEHPDPLLLAFAEQWWSRTPQEDLLTRNPDDDAAATIDSWRLFRQHDPQETRIFVTNPNQARDGWESRHTVVRILTPDMSFVTDSVLMALSHDGLVTHHFSNVVFGARRSPEGQLETLSTAREGVGREVFIYAEIDRISPEQSTTLEQRLARALRDVRAAVGDFAAMRARLAEIIRTLREAPPPVPQAECEESIAFLEWLQQYNFTLLGYRAFDYRDGIIRQDEKSSLGVLRNRRPATPRPLADQHERVRAFLLQPVLLAFSQSGTRSRVHRPAYPDYVGIRRFDADGNVIGEEGFLGLYTARVYLERPERIPLVRRKVAAVLERSGLEPTGFDGKVLNQLLATYPKAELFQTSEDELLRNALRITYIHERRRTRLFVRHDPYGLFVHCLVYMPRDLYNTQVRLRIIEILSEAYGAEDSEFEPWFSESVLVRLQVTLRKRPDVECVVDEQALGLRLLDATRDWIADFQNELIQQFGESESRRLAQDYAIAFPAAYRERYGVRTAVHDLACIEKLAPETPLRSYFYRRPEEPPERLHLKLFHLGAPLPLSDVIATLENTGLRICAEHPYAIDRARSADAAMLDFDLEFPRALDIHEIGERFTEAFEQIWTGQVDDDRYNRLLLAAGLDWRQVNVLRSYARYLKQISFGFGQEFISDTLCRYPDIAADLVRYFELRFTPDGPFDDAAERQRTDLLAAFDRVTLLNEDRILRQILELMTATVRTNYFRRAAAPVDSASGPAPGRSRALALKLVPTGITGMPKPVPAFEIFVSSPTLEGVHLRGGLIARGGLRWSDRAEDYRTEVLGLVKAQTVKNAVIVPTGAKGGFIVRHPSADPERFREQGLACYRDFIGGLLDVTDNVVDGRLVHPPGVRCHDGDDPYLVVAADKGTATFSDAANAMAASYGFWLGDAFASGGSNGYDHKQMGITARGAWISVLRHFAERGIDVQRDRIRVLGIGDMSGDVFGNGMLRSQAIQLVAAFNHRHIFVDPDPDPISSFTERQRLFAMPRSAWSDYDRSLISAGGGVFERTAKVVAITPQMQAAFDIQASHLAPDELIGRLLRAPVDLIWNGGIGTYVKAAAEAHADAGDRANDGLRINAEELHCRVFGEGGNLGMTQRARVAFALAGGAVNTDFIDNSAGVDCSDHEVNIKIALNQLVADGELTPKHRNQLLKEMTDEVGELVLVNNFRQAQLLSLAERLVGDHLTEFQRFIGLMESCEHLDRNLEGLPGDEQIAARAGRQPALTRPELAVLAAFAKTHIKKALNRGTIGTDPEIRQAIFEPFPKVLAERFPEALLGHRLAREIVSTQLANDLVHHMGITFATHLVEFVGATVEEVVRAWLAAAGIFRIRERFRRIEAVAGIPEESRLAALVELIRLGRRATRWLLRHERSALDVTLLVQRYRPGVEASVELRATLLGEAAWQAREARVAELVEAGVDPAAADDLAVSANLALTLTVIAAAASCAAPPAELLETHAALARELDFDWLIDRLGQLPHTSHWQAMERDSLIDDMIMEQGRLTAAVHQAAGGDVPGWLAAREDFRSAWQRALADARQANVADFSLYSVTCRKLLDLGRIA
jgi:glutamate dehydrogenase